MKTSLLQGAALAVLACAMAQPVIAAEALEDSGAARISQSGQEGGMPEKPATALNLTLSQSQLALDAPAPMAPRGLDTSSSGDGAILVAAAATAPPATSPAAPAPARAAGGEPENIIVTALKRETPLQLTPVAIAVADVAFLEKQHVQSLIDLANGTIPSLRIATFEARQSALTVGIRGIVPFDANQTARDQGVGVYLDGVYLGRQQGLNAALLDVERIEVLRGPQGTLFGRNTEGGALSIVTKAPTGVFGGSITTGVGNFGSYNGAMHLNLPEYAHVSVKLDGIIEHQGATTTNPLSGQYGWNYFNRYGGRLSARWAPIENFTADFSLDSSVDENTPFYSQLVNYNPNNKTVGMYDSVTSKLVAPGSPAGTSTVCSSCIAPLSPLVQVRPDRQSAAEIGVPQQLSVDKTNGFSSSLKYEISPALELRSITAWRGVETDQWDNSGGPHRTIFAPNTNFSRYSLSLLQQHQFSQEFQAVGSIPQFDYVFGLYYFNEHASEQAATPSSNRWNVDGTGYTINSQTAVPPITSANQGWDLPSWFTQRASRAQAESYAAYGQATWTPAALDRLHLTAGGRYTHDKRDGLLYTVQGKASNFLFNFNNGRFDPMVTLAADATDDIHVYFTYSTGFRAGGANDRSQTFSAFGPEEVNSYEIGVKSDLFDRRVRLNVAGYLMDRSGTQTDFDNVDTNPTSPTFNLHTEETRNAQGTSKIRGAEVEGRVIVTDNLTVGASYAYTHVEIPPTANPFLTGNPLFPVFVVFTPKNATSIFADYERMVGGMTLVFHIDASYADPVYSFQAEPVLTQASTIVNARIALADIPVGSFGQMMTLSVWARNLLDESHIYRMSAANASTLGYYANFNPPRTFGVQATVNF